MQTSCLNIGKFDCSTILPAEINLFLKNGRCPYRVKERFYELANEMNLYWGEPNKKIYQRWLSNLYEKLLNDSSTDKKLNIIDNYLQSINYQNQVSERKKIISELDFSYGYAYVLSAEYMPNIIKIGMTESLCRDGFDRARELSTTGVPGKYKVEYQRRVLCSRDAETKILDKFEDNLKNNNTGHRTNTDKGKKKETFFVNKKNYIDFSIGFVRAKLNIHEKTIFRRIGVEVFKEKEIIRSLENIQNKINQGTSKKKVVDLIDNLKYQINYLRNRRGLNTLFPKVDSEAKIFYMSVNHCAEWLDALLDTESQKIDFQPMLLEHIKNQINISVKLLPKSLPNKSLNSDG